jgi:hypothetical protein
MDNAAYGLETFSAAEISNAREPEADAEIAVSHDPEEATLENAATLKTNQIGASVVALPSKNVYNDIRDTPDYTNTTSRSVPVDRNRTHTKPTIAPRNKKGTSNRTPEAEIEFTRVPEDNTETVDYYVAMQNKNVYDDIGDLEQSPDYKNTTQTFDYENRKRTIPSVSVSRKSDTPDAEVGNNYVAHAQVGGNQYNGLSDDNTANDQDDYTAMHNTDIYTDIGDTNPASESHDIYQDIDVGDIRSNTLHVNSDSLSSRNGDVSQNGLVHRRGKEHVSRISSTHSHDSTHSTVDDDDTYQIRSLDREHTVSDHAV